MAAMHGRWLFFRSTRWPNSAMRAAAASGIVGMRMRKRGSNMAGFFLALGLVAGGGEPGLRGLGLRRRQRLLVHGRLLARLAQVLPEADVQRLPPAVEHED